MDDLLHLFGLLHPLLLHAPLGALIALAALEAWYALRGRELEARRALAVFTLLTAAAAAGSGWLLAGAGGYGGEVLFRHRWAGVSLTVLIAATAVTAGPVRRRPYLASLALALTASVLSGHWGATITHGAGYFRLEESAPPVLSSLEPTTPPVTGSRPGEPTTPAGPAAAREPGYADVEPLFATYCVACHGPTKQKARLAMHNPAVLATGGFSGPVLVPGDPDASELLRRLRLPLDDEDEEHMPPPGKPQPEPAQVELVKRWIRAGAELPGAELAPITEPEPGSETVQPAPPEGETGSLLEPPAPASAPDPVALERLLQERIHVELLDAERGLLWVDCTARADADDAQLHSWLGPLTAHVLELSLAGTAVTDEGLALVARMTSLERLDLSRTSVTSAGLEALDGHARLRSLNVSVTAVDDRALALELPALERLFTVGSAVTPGGLARAQTAHPALTLVTGEPNAALETEPPPVMGDPEAPQPGNATCPVSGKPVDARFTLVWEDELIGFCCANCPGTFEEDPERYAVVR